MIFGLVCVNYHCESDILKMLATLPDCDNITITLVDNSATIHSTADFDRILIDPRITLLETPENLGYFGALNYAVDELRLSKKCDVIMIVNPDIEFSENFFEILSSTRIESSVGVIAPNIINMPLGIQGNPFMITRPTRLDMKIKIIAHSNKYTYTFYAALHRFKNRMRKSRPPLIEACDIYAPHGSLVIFTRTYFSSGASLKHFGFLFAEEIFVAEQARRNGLRIIFEPKLNCIHNEHTSTKKIGKGKLSIFAYNSLNQLYRRYFAPGRNHKSLMR